MITGVFNGVAPWLTGRAFDTYESYTVPFLAMVGVGLAGGIAAFLCRPPRRPTDT